MTHLYRVRTRKTASSHGRRRRGKSDTFRRVARAEASATKVYLAVATVSLRNFCRKFVDSRPEPEPQMTFEVYLQKSEVSNTLTNKR